MKVQCWHRLFAFFILLYGIYAKKNQILFMDKCDSKKLVLLGGAVVYSHRNQEDLMYSDKIDCQITFKADDGASRIMMQIVNMDLPDQSYNKLCNDALYVYDSHNIFGRTLKQAGGTGGLCGKKSPTIINSSAEFLTLYFRTDNGGPSGHGFKLIMTSFSDESAETSSCGQRFECRNQKCIDRDLLCDRVDHCGDYSDEQPDSYSQCELKDEPGFLADFLSLGITAAIAITVGSVVVCVVCVVCIVCLCCKCTRNKRQEQAHCTTTTTTTATSVTINNGAPPITIGGYPQGGYFPMQPVQQQQQHHPITQGLTFSPYPPHRNSYSQTSAYSSSHPPPSYHRSFTPTSSKSGRSQHSVDSAIKMHCDRESIITPTHL